MRYLYTEINWHHGPVYRLPQGPDWKFPLMIDLQLEE